MKITITKTGIILSFMIIFWGCNSKLQPLKKYKITDDTKLYFYNIPSDTILVRVNDNFKLKYGNFYIDDINILKVIKNEWVFEKSTKKVQMESIYRVSLLNKNKILWSAFINLYGKELLTDPCPLNFDIKIIEKYSNNFKPLNAFVIYCDNITNARVLYEEITKNDFFIFTTEKEKGKNSLYVYDGITSLLLPIDKDEHNFRKIKESVEKDLKKIKNVEVTNFSASIDRDSIGIDIYSKVNILKDIPDKYTITMNFKEITNVELPVFGITKDELEQIISKLNLKGNVTVKEIK